MDDGYALRRSGIGMVGDVAWGTHFCQYYENKQDLLDLLIPYFKAGLEQNEKCVWELFAPLSELDARTEMERAYPGSARRIAAGDLVFAGPQATPGETVRQWREQLEHALARGHTGMRVNANATATAGGDWQRLEKYEEAYSEAIEGREILLLCAYPAAEAGKAAHPDSHYTHQCALARQRGRWRYVEPPELRDARASARALTQELSARATERTRELTVAHIDFSRETALRLEAEEALRGSEERLQCYFGLRLVGLAMLEFGPKRLEVNDRMCEMLGYSREELQGLNWAKLTHPDDLDAEMRSYAQLVSGEKSHFLQRKRWVGKNGNLVHSKISAKCKRHDNGAIEYVAVMVEEVTERAKEGSSGDSSPLSLREKEVARLIGLGQTVKEIATALGLSEKTVSTYRKRILDKLNLTTTAEIIRHVIRREP